MEGLLARARERGVEIHDVCLDEGGTLWVQARFSADCELSDTELRRLEHDLADEIDWQMGTRVKRVLFGGPPPGQELDATR